MPSSKAAEPCFLLPHNHNRATSETVNTCQTQDFHSYTSSYYVQLGHDRQLYKAWKVHIAPVSEVQFRLYRERKAFNILSCHLLGAFSVAAAGCFQVLCCNLLKVNNSMVYWGGKESTQHWVCSLWAAMQNWKPATAFFPDTFCAWTVTRQTQFWSCNWS